MTHGAYEKVRQAAQSLHRDQLKVFSVEPMLARANIMRGLSAIEQREPELKALFKHYQSPRKRLEEVLDALDETTEQVALTRPCALGVHELAVPLYEDRRNLMLQLTTWALVGLVDERAERRIKEGRGPIDAANDVLAIIELVNQSTELQAKVMQDTKELKSMATRANALLAVLTPTGVQRRPNAEYLAALDRQTRVFTLLVEAHEVMWCFGCMLFGKRVDDSVPPMGSRAATRKRNKKTEISSRAA